MPPLLKRNKAPVEHIKYHVYIHHHPENIRDIFKKWERKGETVNMSRALKKAKALHRRNQYERIEIKKRVFNNKTNKTRDFTLKTYGKAKKKNHKDLITILAMIALLITVSGLLIFAITP